MQVNIILNGTKVTAEAAPDTLLIDFVRAHGCYSVKRGCETSNCGLCTAGSPCRRPQGDHAGGPAGGGC